MVGAACLGEAAHGGLGHERAARSRAVGGDVKHLVMLCPGGLSSPGCSEGDLVNRSLNSRTNPWLGSSPFAPVLHRYLLSVCQALFFLPPHQYRLSWGQAQFLNHKCLPKFFSIYISCNRSAILSPRTLCALSLHCTSSQVSPSNWSILAYVQMPLE